MPIYDTGPIQNTQAPRMVSMSIHVANTGRLPVKVGIEAYTLNPPGGGIGSRTIYAVQLVSLNSMSESGSSFTLNDVFANLEVFGVRVITSGLGGSTVAVAISVTRENDAVDPYFLVGELSQVNDLLFAYVANLGPSISVFDTGTNNLVTTIDTPFDALYLAVSPDGTNVYASDEVRSVMVIDTRTNTVTNVITLPITSVPAGMAVTPDGTRLYVACRNDSSIRIIDTATSAIIGFIPYLTAVDPRRIVMNTDGSRAYVCNPGDDTLTVIDTLSNTIITNIMLPDSDQPANLAINPAGTVVYTADFTSGTVSVIDVITFTPISAIFLPPGNFTTSVAITPDGTRLYVASEQDQIFLYNPVSLALITTIFLNSGTTPTTMAITPDGSRLFVTCLNGACIKVIATATNEIIATLPAGAFSDGVVITPILLF
ncbi:beta-propeller fold lactonase family protein [Paenibacillus sp. CF384]|uniref:beta-propeller fold lactonase family protein n=1 Tax=Paenibacillus sp. CF384 TaxID=1884382 RepID=UPI000898D6D4|nr:YncE family protein [Paenibacillus sp. CF384]SDX70472.1 40-residue YVTN family beta-propeller repeat-containing protein [Paenibacillus sp. CF384]